MNISPFKVEEWMNAYETQATINIAETCVNSVSLDELFALTGENKQAFLNAFCQRRLTYGDIVGKPELREGICDLFKTLRPDEVATTHGAAGANHLAMYALIRPGDHVVCVLPTYQQLYSIPQSFGAQVDLLPLREENGFLPDLDELRSLIKPNTRLICLNNPNNPTGALMDQPMLEAIVAMAREVGAYVLCDEVYRHLTQTDVWSASIVDLYEKGISIGSMSKVFSLAGLRLGWVASHDADFINACLSRRDYSLISCGMFDEAVASLALRHSHALLARNRGIVRDNLAILTDLVEKEKRVHFVRPQAGTTALLFYDSPMPSYVFCEKLLAQTGALLTPGACFELEGCARIGYACDGNELKAGLAAISSTLDTL